MKKQILKFSFLLTAFAVLTLSSCKKEDTSDDSISAEDHGSASSAMNSSTDDAANAVGGIHSLSGKTDGAMQLCGVTVDAADSAIGKIVITFNGNDCSNKVSRTGTITATLVGYATGNRWSQQGAVLNLDFSNVVVTNIATGGHVTLNGTHTLTNVTGGLAWKLMADLATGYTTVVHRHTASNFSLTFADGTQRTWSVDRLRTFTNIGGVKTIAVSSDHTENGVAYVDAWGTNRKGDAFVNSITTPITANSTCGYYKPVAGVFTHEVGNRNLQINYGVDANGIAVTGGNCAFGYKVTFTKAGHSRTRIVSYWF